MTLKTGALRARRRVKHAVVEADALDLAWPPLREHGLAERNLEAIMRNYMARVRPAGGLRHGRRQGRYTQAQFLSARQGAGSRDT